MSAFVTHRYWPKWFALAWFAAGLLMLAAIGGCRRGVPVVDLAPKPLTADGTISGSVRGPEGTSPVDGRPVEVVNIETGERHRATTGTAGGFTFKVPPGKYRVELTLRSGESIVKHPNIIDLTRSDVDTHVDFLISTPRVSRPRGYRAEDGLGAPMA